MLGSDPRIYLKLFSALVSLWIPSFIYKVIIHHACCQCRVCQLSRKALQIEHGPKQTFTKQTYDGGSRVVVCPIFSPLLHDDLCPHAALTT